MLVPRPLIRVCDLQGYAAGLTEHPYKDSLRKYVEVHGVKVNLANYPSRSGR